KGASPKHAVGQPSCKSSRTSSPHLRITSNHSRATAPNSPACSFIQPSMAGSRSTAPLNRSNSVLLIAATVRFRDQVLTCYSLFISQRHHGIDSGCAPCRHVSGDQGNRDDGGDGSGNGEGIVRR